MNNEKGFVLPFTLFISMLFTYFFIHEIEVYSIESKIAQEHEQLMILESLIQIGSVDLVAEIEKTDAPYNYSGNITYPHGILHYSFKKINDSLLRVDVSAETIQNRTYSIIFVYDYTKKAVIKWVEG